MNEKGTPGKGQGGVMCFFPIILAHFLALSDPLDPAPKNRAIRLNKVLTGGACQNVLPLLSLAPQGLLRSAQCNFLGLKNS
jgi:hypothetical protein